MRLMLMLLVVCATVQIFQANKAVAQDEHSMTGHEGNTIVENWPNAEYGTYGYHHRKLYVFGTITQLMKITKKSCCDGGNGGECRATTIRMQSPMPVFNHNGVWCPIDIDINVVDLPADENAVVCAPKSLGQVEGYGMCPTAVYCAGVPGTT